MRDEAILIDKNWEIENSLKDVKAIMCQKPEDKERYECMLWFSNQIFSLLVNRERSKEEFSDFPLMRELLATESFSELQKLKKSNEELQAKYEDLIEEFVATMKSKVKQDKEQVDTS